MSRTIAKSSVTKIDCYPILGKISVGGQATVYKASHPQTGAKVAVKVLSAQMANDQVLRLRFAQECQVARRLNHPNIVRVMDFGLDGDKPFLVMEYVPGESLGDMLDRDRRLPEREAVALIEQIGKALHWAHQRGLFHRDVKPDNILVTADGVAKLTDLGLVKNVNSDMQLTRTQSSLGTPNFTAPEQFDDAKSVDARSDLYALAATLYMAVTGELPFRVRSGFAVGAVYKKKLTNDIAAPRRLAPELSKHVDAAIRKALRAAPDERHATVQEFIDALRAQPAAADAQLAADEVEPVPDKPAAPSKQERRRMQRFAAKIELVCQPFELCKIKIWDGAVVNISTTGLCMELGRRFEPGTVLSIRLGGKKFRLQSVLARVVWVKRQGARGWQLGCHYDHPLSEQQVRQFC